MGKGKAAGRPRLRRGQSRKVVFQDEYNNLRDEGDFTDLAEAEAAANRQLELYGDAPQYGEGSPAGRIREHGQTMCFELDCGCVMVHLLRNGEGRAARDYRVLLTDERGNLRDLGATDDPTRLHRLINRHLARARIVDEDERPRKPRLGQGGLSIEVRPGSFGPCFDMRFFTEDSCSVGIRGFYYGEFPPKGA